MNNVSGTGPRPDLILWGKHERYAGGYWIKLARGIDNAEYSRREKQGFSLRYLIKGEHPDAAERALATGNPYPKRKGFGLRAHRAGMAIRRLARDPSADIYTRGFDNCFEMHDGDTVVWALMHKALQEPDRYGQSLLTEGIGQMFRGTLDGAPYLRRWLDIYYSKSSPVNNSQAIDLAG